MPDLDSLTDESIDGMPEPSPESENFVTGEADSGDSDQPSEDTVADSDEAVNSFRPTDKDGVTFDPEQHATDAEGRPKTRKDGRWAKKRGRKKGDQTGSTLGTGGVGKKQSARTAEANHVMTGKALASMTITMGRAVSSDFEPVYDPAAGVDERLMLEQAFAEYAESRDMQDIPPGIALSMALMVYITPRLAMTHTQTRMQRFSNWAGSKWLAWKNRRAKKAGKKAKPDKTEDKAEDKENAA